MAEPLPLRNSFRAAVVRGERPQLVVDHKQPRLDGSGDSLEGAIVARTEARRGDHRDHDRHRLTDETATLRFKGKSFSAEVINLSGGGAMVRSDCSPRLWEMVELELGGGMAVEAAVRWIKNDNIGIEFAHETRIDCDPEERAALLLEVIKRSFPDVHVELDSPDRESDDGFAAPDGAARSDMRHPLIWKGQLHTSTDSQSVRLRNVSAGGALVDVMEALPVGTEVVLDLGNAGQFQASVCWSCGDQSGLHFAEPFDLNCLAQARPNVAPQQWVKPSYLDLTAEDSSSPWDENWNRSSLGDLRNQLEGFLKR